MALAMSAKIKKPNMVLVLTTIVPTLLSVVYFGLLASDVYISDSTFVVRRPEQPSGPSVGLLLKSAGFSNASEETYAAQSYIRSRDALKILNQQSKFQNAFSKSNISLVDRFNSTGLFGSFENLYQYYLGKISINYDTTSSISTLSVRAYSAADARNINESLLQLTESTVNRLNERARRDLIRVAERNVADAKRQAQAAALALSNFRNASRIIDPERQAVIQMQMISKMQDQLIATQTQLAQLLQATPDNPQIPSLRTVLANLSSEIERQSSAVAGNKGSLSGVAAQYQRLMLESQFSDKQLTAMLASLAEALTEARKQQAYIERIAQPSMPDDPLEPKRLRGIVTTFLLGLVAFGILTMLLAGVKEHQD